MSRLNWQHLDKAIDEMAAEGHSDEDIEAAVTGLAQEEQHGAQPGVPWKEGPKSPDAGNGEFGPWKAGYEQPDLPERPRPTHGEAAVHSFIEGFVPGAHGMAGSNDWDTGPAASRANPFMPMVGKPDEERAAGIAAQKERLRQGEEDFPKTTLGTGIVGGATGVLSVPGAVLGTALKAAPVIGGGAKSLLGSLLKGGARGIVAHEAIAPAAAAISDPNEVGGVEAAKQAATSPTGLGLAGLFGAAGGAADRYVSRIQDPKRMSGRTIRDVENAGGKINATGDEPVSGGQFESKALKGAAEGREGVNQVAAQTGKTFTRYNRMKLSAERGAYEREFNDIVAKAGQTRVKPAETAATVSKIIDENSVEGEVVDDALDAVAQKYVSILGKSKDGTLKATDVIKLKKSVADKAEFGQPSTAENRPYRQLYGALAKDSEAIDPERLPALNKRFGDTMASLEEANDITYGQDKTDIADRKAANRTAASTLGRAGDPSQAGTIRADDLARLEELSPVYKKLLTRVRAKKAQENLRAGEEGANQLPIESAVASGKASGLAGWLGDTKRNQQIRGIRQTLPAAKGVSATAPGTGAGAGASGAFWNMIRNSAEAEARRKEEEDARRLQP